MADITIQSIQGKLQEAAGNIKVVVKLDAKMDISSSIRFTNKQILVKMNPKHITTKSVLDKLMGHLIEQIGGI